MAPKKKGAAKPVEKASGEASKKALGDAGAEKEDAKGPLPVAKADPPKECDKVDVEMHDTETKVPEVPKAPEKPTEKEADSGNDPRPRIPPDAINWDMSDAALNVMPSSDGRLLMSLQEGGMQYLLAGVRASMGFRAGRYMFEVRIIEHLSPHEPQSQGRTPQPKQFCRVGFSLAGSPILSGSDGIGFDSEGNFVCGKKNTKLGHRFVRDQVMGLLLNLDPASPNSNTISLFRNGVRACEPQAIPESLQGKVFFPTIVYRNVTLHVNFGPVPKCLLPFSCRMIADAAKEDTVVASGTQAKDVKYEVVLPVGLPDQGTFDWLDGFLEENPSYLELSDRKIISWASESGLWKPKGGAGASNDKPQFNFGVPLMDDASVRRVISTIAPTLRRNLVLMELQSNLIAGERKKELINFPSSDFKKTTVVVMGEPDKQYVAKVQDKLLAEKTARVDAERKRKAAEKDRRRLLEERRKKAEEARTTKLAEAKKKAEARRAAQAEDNPEAEPKEANAEEAVDDENDAKKEDEEQKKDEDAEEPEVGPVELSDEEKKQWHRKMSIPDIAPNALGKSFTSFSVPSKEEGFDEVKFAWQPREKSVAHLRAWIQEMKKTQKVEDLQPSQWFKDESAKFNRLIQEWKRCCTEWADPAKRKALLQKRKDAAKIVSVEGDRAEDKGEEKADDDAAEAEAEMEINADDVDVMTVADINDIGSGEPLYSKFAFEDWALLSIAFEVHLLVHAFRKDLDDPDRPGFSDEHFPFYYQKYYKKYFSVKGYGIEKFAEFVDLVRDTIQLTGESLVRSKHQEDAPHELFVRLTEEDRRERERRVDAGDETARLKFSRDLARPAAGPAGGPGAGGPGAGGPGAGGPGAGAPAHGPYGAVRGAKGAPGMMTYGGQKRPHPGAAMYGAPGKAQRAGYGYGAGPMMGKGGKAYGK